MTPEPAPSPRKSAIATGAEAAAAVAHSLASQPMLLGFVVINLVFIGAVFYVMAGERRDEHRELTMVLERCIPK